MPDARLAELLRQRALLSEHVAWLDGEIARASGGSTQEIPPASHLLPAPSAPSPVSDPPPAPTPPAPPLAEPVPQAVALANKRADEIIAEYATTDKFNPAAARRSCLLLALAVLLLGTAALIGVYLLKYR